MTGQPQDPSDRTPSFGPNRHRMEIELMEKRFRERSDRSGGGPVATEEIDIRIADEARQFFDDSAKTLEVVVPQLQEGDQGREMLETTGEIRKKIDEFFTDAGAPQGAHGAHAAPSGQTGSPRRAASAAVPPAPPMSTGVPAAAQMDLKTALEKLRRHGAAKTSGQVPRPASPPPGRQPVLDSSASLEARPSAAPPRPASSESPASMGDALPRMDATAPAVPQPPRPRESDALMRQLSSLPPIDTDETGRPVEPPPTLRGHRPPETREFTDEDEPKEPAAAAPEALAGREPESAPERAPAAERLRTPAPDFAGGEFDSIFSAVEGIVLDTLKSSMNETMSAARKSEPELAHVAVPTAEPMMEVPDAPDTVTQDLSQDLSDRVQAGESEDVSEGFAHEVAPKLPAPRDDDEDDDLDSDLPAAGPYDWGVKPVARPKGAWLLDTPEGGAEAPAPAKSPAEAAPAPEAPSPGGPRAFLIRKASDEVRKFQPVMDALHKSNLIDPDQIAPGSGGPSLADEDEDSVSLDSFRDDRPSPEELEAELSPMRLVEELRRLRRVTQALVEKGVISGEDLGNSESD
jgi:hypothetical protein